MHYLRKNQQVGKIVKYITRTQGGYMFRKRLNGVLSQTFFGDADYGGPGGAKEAAIAYRNDLVNRIESKDIPWQQWQNKKNKTGITGVIWLPPSPSGDTNSCKHVIRAHATYPNNPHRLHCNSWSVDHDGLWRAYFSAADWRHRAINDDEPIDLETLINGFKTFMETYLEVLHGSDSPIRSALLDALLELVKQDCVPREIVDHIYTRAKSYNLYN